MLCFSMVSGERSSLNPWNSTRLSDWWLPEKTCRWNSPTVKMLKTEDSELKTVKSEPTRAKRACHVMNDDSFMIMLVIIAMITTLVY